LIITELLFSNKMKISLLSSVLKFLIFLTILPINNILPDVRYVSKTGTSQYPYTSWETSSDSIQKCINICNSGDTIYVGSGTYKEQVQMTPGVALLGYGIDSCIIDTRSIVIEPFWAINMSRECIVKNFYIKVSDNNIGGGINLHDFNSLVENNKIEGCSVGIVFGSSSSIIKNNIISNFNDVGVLIISTSFNYYPVVDNNLILAPSPSNTIGINVSINSRPTIKNNIIFLDGAYASGYAGGGSDSTWVYNNLVVANRLYIGFDNSIVPTFEYGNAVIGNGTGVGFTAENKNILKNNIAVNLQKGFSKGNANNPVIKYNDAWGNGTMDYFSFTPDSTNLSIDPMFVNDSSDFHLQMFSPLIDKGDPTILDKDGTRSDIGIYGGPFGERYDYKDLPPRPPRGLILTKNSSLVTIKWNKNTETDFNHYNLYRDTVSGFTIGDKTFVSSLTDTAYRHIIQSGATKYYYKLTAADNQGNISPISEELGIYLTSVKDKPQLISEYQLFHNYPNPFNPTTIIPYRLKERGYVKLTIYDIKGEQVEVLVNQTQEAGYYEVEFMGKNSEKGKTLVDRIASGIYLYRLDVKNQHNIPVYSEMKKMVLLK
jgi:hypothetical protein